MMIPRKLLDNASVSRETHTQKSEVSSTYLTTLRAVRNSTPSNTKQHVVIIGAGMAGLSSAYELQRLGYRVTVLEAEKKHIGGRVKTLRFNDGLYIEAGAMRIPDSHHLTHHYIQEFDLPTRSFVQSNPKSYVYLRGQRFRASEEEVYKKLYDLTDDEKSKSTLNMWLQTINSVIDKLDDHQKKDLFSDEPKNQYVRELCRRSLYHLLTSDEVGLSQEAIDLLLSSWGLDTIAHYSLGEHVREEIENVWGGNFQEIIGGTDLLATEFAKHLQNSIKLGSEVFEISRDNNSKETIVHYKDASGTTHSQAADWVICTVPLGALQHIKFTPEISAQKQRAMRCVNYDSATKVVIKASCRFWELHDGIYGGGTVWDSPLTYTWYPSDNVEQNAEISKQPAMLLASYSWGQRARRIDAIPYSKLKQFIINELSKVHPILETHPEYIEQVVRWSWDASHLSSGAYAFFRPGEHLDLHKTLTEAEGNILIAGEHASLTHSWIQGALESAVRAVNKITQN